MADIPPAYSPTPYDVVEYPARPRRATHPDRLATIARLYGLEPVDPRCCRVLELGCSDGGNLASLAVALPGARFVGIDSALTSIEEGKRRLAELRLGNVELRWADLLELDQGLGTFDYVIAHGVYSWVPQAVRERLLALCGASLAPRGIAFVSYNAYPGGYLRRAARDLMVFHARGIADPEERIRSGLSLLADTAAQQPAGSPYRAALEFELNQLVRAGTSFVFHDVLAPENQPSYFADFVADAARFGLAYLSDAEFFESCEAARLNGLASSVPEASRADVLRSEQYLDFIKGRAFRQTLLVAEGTPVDRRITPARTEGLLASAAARPVEPGKASGPEQQFLSAAGSRITTDHPIAEHAFAVLSEAWPRALAFADLLRCTLERMQYAGAEREAAEALGTVLLRGYASNVVELRSTPIAFTVTPGERPLASPLVRLQARSDEPLSSLRHTMVPLEHPVPRALLRLMDGTRTRAELAQQLRREIGDEGATSSVAPPAAVPIEDVERIIGELAALALLSA